ncbi:hypothetical protein T4A_2370 [Trichinella pseudospiralis]|uniref:Uncharacterized protein n=1 Tax=Trichinella pseudospiralis TaxID=6337 RepID=A0A0V1E5W7_TRIPS|nr:hypothetical protein T4A_2370 [Trichinella pseudospiralis]KRZ26379.1 hypothetical protein T4C_3032 [Trichinella pseudospiralis]
MWRFPQYPSPIPLSLAIILYFGDDGYHPYQRLIYQLILCVADELNASSLEVSSELMRSLFI